jgi:hypothetical protein
VTHDEDIGDGLFCQGVDNALAHQARAIPGYGQCGAPQCA